MRLDSEACYRAFAARERRFEGRFVMAVVTTRIYCRPGCPAPLPRRRNVRFYACAAAAEEAGFRPCLRCRPETAPGSPAWLGTSATVQRALRLIGEGHLDAGGVDALAARLGVGARHLRRLFDAQLGASPVAIAQTRRVHFARRLLDDTDLPITEVALASGFGSLRRFHHTMRKTFRRAPRELRRSRSRGGTADAGRLQLAVPYRAPLDWPALLAFLATRAIPGVEHVTGDCYARTFRLGEACGTWSARPLPGTMALAVTLDLDAPRELIHIVERIRRVFDLDADAAAIRRQLVRDPVLSRAYGDRRGVRVPGAWDPFEMTVRAVLGQQISVRAATTLTGRIAQQFGEPVTSRDVALTRRFPTPERLATARLEPLGIIRSRAAAIRAVARAVLNGALDFSTLGDVAQATTRLAALPGIGPWTAHYLAMRALGEPDAFPAGDLGVRKALKHGGTLPDVRATTARAEAWRPWRAYAVMALWTADTHSTT